MLVSSGRSFVEDDHAQFDLVLDLEIVLMAEVIIFDLVGRNEDFALRRSGCGAPSMYWSRTCLRNCSNGHALRLQGFHQRDAVAETVADAVLHEFIHDAVRQLVALGVEAVENQRAFDQLFQAVVEQVSLSFCWKTSGWPAYCRRSASMAGVGIILHLARR